MFDIYRDPRFSEEAMLYFRSIAHRDSVSDNNLKAEAIREQMEALFKKSNEELAGTFVGSLEERTIKTSSAGIVISIMNND